MGLLLIVIIAALVTIIFQLESLKRLLKPPRTPE